MHDFRCTSCGATYEHFLQSNQEWVNCPDCEGEAKKVFLVPAKPDWLGLAQGTSPSPEAAAKFERMHRQQKKKETRSLNENGDYGPQPGGRGLTYETPIAPDLTGTLPSE
jgi:putative FmdB family regulatory protein